MMRRFVACFSTAGGLVLFLVLLGPDPVTSFVGPTTRASAATTRTRSIATTNTKTATTVQANGRLTTSTTTTITSLFYTNRQRLEDERREFDFQRELEFARQQRRRQQGRRFGEPPFVEPDESEWNPRSPRGMVAPESTSLPPPPPPFSSLGSAGTTNFNTPNRLLPPSSSSSSSTSTRVVVPPEVPSAASSYPVPRDDSNRHLAVVVAGTLWFYLGASYTMLTSCASPECQPAIKSLVFDYFVKNNNSAATVVLLHDWAIYVTVAQLFVYCGLFALARVPTLRQAQWLVAGIAALSVPANLLIVLTSPWISHSSSAGQHYVSAQAATIVALAEIVFCVGVYVTHYLRKASYREMPPLMYYSSNYNPYNAVERQMVAPSTQQTQPQFQPRGVPASRLMIPDQYNGISRDNNNNNNGSASSPFNSDQYRRINDSTTFDNRSNKNRYSYSGRLPSSISSTGTSRRTRQRSGGDERGRKPSLWQALQTHRPPQGLQASFLATDLARSFVAFAISVSAVEELVAASTAQHPYDPLIVGALIHVAFQEAADCIITTMFPGSKERPPEFGGISSKKLLQAEIVMYAIHLFASFMALTHTNLGHDNFMDQALFVWMFVSATERIFSKTSLLMGKVDLDAKLGLSNLDQNEYYY